MRRLIKNLIHTTLFDNFPRIHYGDLIRHLRNNSEIMRH
jgi:hypothetical protein